MDCGNVDWLQMVVLAAAVVSFVVALVATATTGRRIKRAKRDMEEVRRRQDEIIEMQKQSREIVAGFNGAQTTQLSELPPEARVALREGMMQLLAELKRMDN